ncbi:MAG: sugar phosphate isomerase/epimerase family protein [Thermoguttaceae bacterium]
MGRPITMFTGQWGDLKLEEVAKTMKGFGYDGLELMCGAHIMLDRAMKEGDYIAKIQETLKQHGLGCWAISNHCVGQCVLDPIDPRHKVIVPSYIWGDGNPEGVWQRAAEDMKNSARVAQKMGIKVVNGFTGSSIWQYLYTWPPTPDSMIEDGFKLFAERWNPILDVFAECGVKFALEVHPTEIAFDLYSAEKALDAIKWREEFGFNFDPSHLIWQGVDPARFILRFKDRIYHTHMKDTIVRLDGETGALGSHLTFGDYRRGWNFRSLGHGSVNFEEIVRALNFIGYTGPLSVEWEDSGMDRLHGAKESREFLRKYEFAVSEFAFDSNFDKE